MRGSLNDLLPKAQKEHRAVAAVNCYSLETIRAALTAAATQKMPVILAFAARYQTLMTYRQFVTLADMAAEPLEVAYAIHLDHCGDMEEICRAMDAGFTSVMYDGSALPFGENLERTRQVTALAHSRGVSVEAELGAVKTGEHSDEQSGAIQRYTQPEEARTFVDDTGVDALAVSIGTAHGAYREAPEIRLDILRALREAVDTPLVLHGGSGNPETVLRQAVTEGICKINFNTDVSQRCVDATRSALEQDAHLHLSRLLEIQYQAAVQAVSDAMSLCQGTL